MKLQGSIFVEDHIDVVDKVDDRWPVSICLDGLEVVIHLTEEQARELDSKLGNALVSIDHDRTMA